MQGWKISSEQLGLHQVDSTTAMVAVSIAVFLPSHLTEI
jgi:hypothetical protein